MGKSFSKIYVSQTFKLKDNLMIRFIFLLKLILIWWNNEI